MIGGAIIDGDYRYALWRRWNPRLKPMTWIMLNPSTADAETNDQTIRRCIFFAEREGCGSIEVINLYAYRATQPDDLALVADPEGPYNAVMWELILHEMLPEGPVVAAWGASAPAGLPESQAFLREQLREGSTDNWYCLGKTANGSPRHPSRLGNDAQFERIGSA